MFRGVSAMRTRSSLGHSPGNAALQFSFNRRQISTARFSDVGTNRSKDLTSRFRLRCEKGVSTCRSTRWSKRTVSRARPLSSSGPRALTSSTEEALRRMGLRQFRVRHHGDIVRIEIARDEMPRAFNPEMATEFTRIFKALGFSYVTLDLEGFRSGSMNALRSAARRVG